MMLSDIFLTRFLTDVVHLNHPETSQRRFAPTPDHFTGISGPLHWNTQSTGMERSRLNFKAKLERTRSKMNSNRFSSLESEIAIQAQASGASRGQKPAPGLSSFLAIFRFETGLCQYLPLLDTYHPSIYKYNISNADLLTEPNPQIGCKSLIAPCNNGLRHRLIQDGRYDTA